jgi:hypothetical protein
VARLAALLAAGCSLGGLLMNEALRTTCAQCTGAQQLRMRLEAVHLLPWPRTVSTACSKLPQVVVFTKQEYRNPNGPLKGAAAEGSEEGGEEGGEEGAEGGAAGGRKRRGGVLAGAAAGGRARGGGRGGRGWRQQAVMAGSAKLGQQQKTLQEFMKKAG